MSKPRKPISRLTKPKILRSFSRKLLIQLLDPYKDFLASHEVQLPPTEVKKGNYDFIKLSKILCGAPDRPEQLLLAFDQIGVLTDPEGAEILTRQLKANGETLPENVTNHDLAASAYLAKKGIFSVALQKKKIVDTRKFHCFRARASADLSKPNLDDSTMQKMEAELSAWFYKNRRGKGCDLIPSGESNDDFWLLAIHGGTRRVTPTFKNKETEVLDFHPEQDDVIRFDLSNRRIWIHANSPAEINLYRAVVGQYLFGDHGIFETEMNLYDLEPLRKLGADSLQTKDIPGCPIESINLREIVVVVDSDNGTKWNMSSQNDLFESIGKTVVLPQTGFIKSAKFYIKFTDHKDKSRVGITLPATADYENDGHSEWVENWLKHQRFWLDEDKLNDAEPETLEQENGSLESAA